jgi:hypothetical protein
MDLCFGTCSCTGVDSPETQRERERAVYLSNRTDVAATNPTSPHEPMFCRDVMLSCGYPDAAMMLGTTGLQSIGMDKLCAESLRYFLYSITPAYSPRLGHIFVAHVSCVTLMVPNSRVESVLETEVGSTLQHR